MSTWSERFSLSCVKTEMLRLLQLYDYLPCAILVSLLRSFNKSTFIEPNYCAYKYFIWSSKSVCNAGINLQTFEIKGQGFHILMHILEIPLPGSPVISYI